ncbi:MAG: ATP-grasp domain-containing protein [Syntrophomonadaceae bacterium]|nr:ATP-grasp domain-containing protein [Syntrophomonadaceae bacterium]
MNGNLKILVTDGNYKHTLGIVRCLGIEGYTVYVASTTPKCLAGLSIYCKNTLITCNWNDNDNERQYIEQIKDYCNKYNIDLVIPVGYKNCILFSKYKDQILKVSNVIIADYQKMIFALNKAKILDFAKQLSVGIPDTIYPKSLSEVKAIAHTLNYPCVIKSRFEHGANVVAYPQNKKELEEEYSKIVNKYKFTNENLPMIQEYLTGDGYAFFALYINGECKQIFMHHRLREFPITGGASVKAEAFYDEKLLASGKKLLDALEWHGVAMVEFKKDAQGNYKLMEINPKYWGSTDLALAAGALFPVITAQYIEGVDVKYSDHYDYTLKYHWPCDGDWVHAIYKPSHFFDVLKDCFNITVKSNWWWKEYRVNLYLIKRLIKDIAKAVSDKMGLRNVK